MYSCTPQAAKFSAELVRVAAERGDSRTQLEARAYSAWMYGNLYLQKEGWADALKRYTQARSVLLCTSRLLCVGRGVCMC